MPHLVIRHVPEETLAERSARLADRLAEAIGCERSWITLDLDRSVRIVDGRIAGCASVTGSGADACPYVTVDWFRRPEPVRAAVAAVIADELRGRAAFVTTVFRELDPAAYFEDGKAFG